MDKVGIKICSNNEMTKCVKILRKYRADSINEIRDCILNNKYVLVGNYVDEDDILSIIKLYNELCENGIEAELFEHDRKTDIAFLHNLVKMYIEINSEIKDDEN